MITSALEHAPGIFNNCIPTHPPCRVRLSYRDILQKIFNNHCPVKEEIGVQVGEKGQLLPYMSIQKGRRVAKCEIYIALVEFMCSKDLVMITLINDVKFLIIASTTLCSDSQKWNNKHNLWGLFYRTRQDTNGYAEGSSNKVIDMDIDMIS
ncbi:hypothetical protein KY289_020529 [Solanum tuberosum]|nr:hypothetical protein KY289_020529 [Solanum tuberosum]